MSDFRGPWLAAITPTGYLAHAARALYRGDDLVGYQTRCGRSRVELVGRWDTLDDDALCCLVCLAGGRS